jgi:Porin subfamily
MNLVKILLLGTTTGFVFAGAVQAADLETKAKATDSVRVCTLYGEGFYQIPGEGDICIKVGATVRLGGGFNEDGNGNPFLGNGPDSRNNGMDTRDFLFQGRGTVWFDARQMTQYGVLKAYFSGGFEAATGTTTTGTAFWKRGYIQLAGARIGKSRSSFDFNNGTFSYDSGHFGGGSDTYDSGLLVAGYTGDFGLGISATLAVEDSTARRNALWDATSGPAVAGAFPAGQPLPIGSFPGPGALAFGALSDANCIQSFVRSDTTLSNSSTTNGFSAFNSCPTGDYAAAQVPDIVANLRVDQGWGSAQVAAALHQVRAGFYGNDVRTDDPTYTGQSPQAKWGFAVMGGAMVNLPWSQGDRVWVEAAFSQGAPSYNGLSGSTFGRFDGGAVAAAWALDGVFANNAAMPMSGIQLATAWDISAAVEHHWTPTIRSSVFGQYTAWNPGTDGNTIMCSSPQAPTRTVAGAAPTGAAALAGCNFAFDVWSVGTRTVWNPVSNLDIGVEIKYSRINTSFDPNLIRLSFSGAGGTPGPLLYTPSIESIWSSLFRVQYHFGAPPGEEGRS